MEDENDIRAANALLFQPPHPVLTLVGPAVPSLGRPSPSPSVKDLLFARQARQLFPAVGLSARIMQSSAWLSRSPPGCLSAVPRADSSSRRLATWPDQLPFAVPLIGPKGVP